jgi:glycosyltransferase involved in cell wall biosynthesis
LNLAVVTNILTPYRLPLFEAIRSRVDRFHVLLMAAQEENRDWKLGSASFSHEVLPGLHLRPPGAEVSTHVNYGVMRALRRVNPDVVLSGGFAPANVAAWLYCRLHRRPFVGWGELSTQDLAQTSMPKRGLRRVMTSWSDGAIASSSEARDAFAHYGAQPERILTAIMPIDVERFHALATAWRASPRFRAERARFPGPILMSVGRLTERKGYRELFAIYAEIVRRRPDVFLLIVGNGPERAEHEASVRTHGWTRVQFLGFQQAEEVVKLLTLADVFVFHTLCDPFGAVLSEAMAAGVPAVSSVYAGATRDLIEDGVTGFRIDPKDPTSAAATITKVLDLPPEQIASLRRAAYDRVKISDIEPSADRMVAFLRGLVGSGHRGTWATSPYAERPRG